jgi:hypothetical protein
MRRFAYPMATLARLPVTGSAWSSLVRRRRLVQVGDWITQA